MDRASWFSSPGMSHHSLFERSVWLNASPESVYAFHQDPRNITRISPASLKVEEVSCSVPACPREEFRLKVRQFGIPLEWVGFWEAAEFPSRLVDGARKSPFRHWRHHHVFRPERGGTLMTDRVEYALPFGVIGRILACTVAKGVLQVLFRSRHKATLAFFSNGGGY